MKLDTHILFYKFIDYLYIIIYFKLIYLFKHKKFQNEKNPLIITE